MAIQVHFAKLNCIEPRTPCAHFQSHDANYFIDYEVLGR